MKQMDKTTVIWKKEMNFEAWINDHRLMIDLPEASGGSGLGPSPLSLLLPALAGCSSMGVVGILKKMRLEDFTLEIDVKGDKSSEHPTIYTNIALTYKFTGKELPESKLQKAVSVSEERYCGVYAMLAKTAVIKSIITLNGVEI
jgi:putative redox protein